jgi:hypothetical protein
MEVGLAGTAPRQRAATSPDIGNLGVGQFYIATEGSSYPPWLAGLARQRWEVELPAAAAMQGRVLVREESAYGYRRASRAPRSCGAGRAPPGDPRHDGRAITAGLGGRGDCSVLVSGGPGLNEWLMVPSVR